MDKIKRSLFLSLATGLTVVFSLNSQEETPYMLPPDEILSIADVSATLYWVEALDGGDRTGMLQKSRFFMYSGNTASGWISM